MPINNILFFGTSAFALPALKGLVQAGYPVGGVVTQPDRPQGRGQATAPPPVKPLAEALNLPLFQPEKIRDPFFLEIFRRLAPDLVVVVAFGGILPAEIINTPPAGCINIHPSLLPKHRGAAPINWALIRGEQVTGVTIMRMDEGVDSGPVLLQEETPIGPEETYGELHDRLAVLGAEMLVKTLRMAAAGTIISREQNHALATFAPRLERETGMIRWSDDSVKIVSLIRGLSPTPCAYTFSGKKKLKVFRASAEQAAVAGPPGTVIGESPNELRVAAGVGHVLLKEVQMEGKRRMEIRDFLCGNRALSDQILG